MYSYDKSQSIIFLAFLGFLVPFFFILWKLWGKNINSFLAQYINDDFDKDKLLLPSLLMITLPFVLPILASDSESFWNLIRSIVPVLTFLLGQYLTKRQIEKDRVKKNIALGQRIYSELEKNLTIINRNLENLSQNKLEPLNLEWWEQFNLYFEVYFSEEITFRKKDVTFSFKREIAKLFNNTLFELNIKIQDLNKVNSELQSEFEQPKLHSNLTENLFSSLASTLEVNVIHNSCKSEIQQLLEELSKKTFLKTSA